MEQFFTIVFVNRWDPLQAAAKQNGPISSEPSEKTTSQASAQAGAAKGLKPSKVQDVLESLSREAKEQRENALPADLSLDDLAQSLYPRKTGMDKAKLKELQEEIQSLDVARPPTAKQEEEAEKEELRQVNET